jgi:DNA-binding LacI/PurR family transcriptional regulator
MYEIFIKKTYEHDELQNMINQRLADKIDGVIMHWNDATSVMIENLHNISIHEVMLEIQKILGSNVDLILVPEEE